MRHRKLAPPAGSWVYELTEWGQDLEPVIIQLGRCGIRSPAIRRNVEFSADSLILALKTMFDPDLARGFRARYELRLGEDRFRAVVTNGQIDLARGSEQRPDAVIEANVSAKKALLWNSPSLAEALCSGNVKIDTATTSR